MNLEQSHNYCMSANTHLQLSLFFTIFFYSSEDKWKYVMIFLLSNTLACVTLAILLNINDKRRV